ncbi:eukaryotic cytochrome b561-domain-containing protein [Phycomyces nitens]|nr:eukaryotic cytochrome b561-domain-containing protein [Phycomyces nitens]
MGSGKRNTAAKLCLWTGLGLFATLSLEPLVRMPFSLFSYHPILMVGTMLAITEGIALLQAPILPASAHRQRKTWHGYLQTLGLFAIEAGFTAIYVTKTRNDKPHFSTIHGQLGVMCVMWFTAQAIFGTILAYFPRAVTNLTQKKQYWNWHRQGGYVLLGLMWITSQTGVRSASIMALQRDPILINFHWLALGLVCLGLSLPHT